MIRSYSDRQRALKWVLPTTLRVYGLRPSGKTKGSALKWVLLVTVPRTVLDATASVLTRLGNAAAILAMGPANALRASFAQAGPKEVASTAHSAETSSTTDCVRQARPKEVLRPSCKPACQRTASFLKAVLPTDCVLAPLRQDARSALRSGKMQGVRFAQPVGKVVLVSSDAQPWQQVSLHTC